VRKSWVKSVVWVMVVMFPASMVMANATSAMLKVTGNVAVNGSPIDRATAVFPGDKVQTGPNSMATLTSEGSSVTVPGNSSLVFSKNFVNVLCGTALISTSRGLPVRVSNLLVQPPQGAPARFQVTQKDGQLQIIARQGTLAIDNGTATSALQPGRMLTAAAACAAAPYADTDDSSSPMPQDQSQPDQGQQGKNKHAAPGGGGHLPPAPGGSNTASVLPYAAGAAGISGLVVYLTTRSPSPPASNITPGNGD